MCWNKVTHTRLVRADVLLNLFCVKIYQQSIPERMIILLLESPCPLVTKFVRWLVTKFQPHHTHMQHSQGLNITDVCIMHICIIIKEHMYMYRAYMIKEHIYMHNRYMHDVYMHQSRGLYMDDKYAAS